MSVWQQLQAIGRRLRSRAARDNARSPLEAHAADPDEARQLDLLLQEIRVNEQHLDPQHWATLAASFRSRLNDAAVPAKEPVTARRTSRYAGAASHGLPLGALLAATLVLVLASPSGSESSLSNDRDSAVADGASSLSPPEMNELARVGRTDAAKSTTTTTKSDEANTAPAPPVVTRSKRPTPRHRLRPPEEAQAPTEAPMVVPTWPVGEPVEVSAARSSSAAELGPTDTFAEQLAALKRADRALKSNNARAARDALAREFSPQLGLHARALRIVLACQDGSVNLGKRALAEQASRYPNSPYLARMRRACGVTDTD